MFRFGRQVVVSIFCACLLAGPAAAAPRTILNPRPGQRVRTATLRLVVLAGSEFGDLVARLNGVSVGEDFARAGHHRRVLSASVSHGLRLGRNVLSVEARIGDTVRRAKVTFTVVRRHPMLGIGRDQATAAGSGVHLHARLVVPRGARAPREVRWTVITRPRGSRLRQIRSRSKTLLFRPDVPGRYVMRAAVGSGPALTRDLVTIDAAPASAMLPVDTDIEVNPPGTHEGDGPHSPGRARGIRVGGVVYRAPWMLDEGRGHYSGRTGDTTYRALFQVVALERGTTQLLWNRTYGTCKRPAFPPFLCRAGGKGELIRAGLGADLANLGRDAIVIAANHPPDTDADLKWDAPGGYLSDAFTPIGGPAHAPLGEEPGGAAIVGVPGAAPGAATWQYRETGRARLNGYLLYDIYRHFGYVPAERRFFDTRTPGTCAGGFCTVSQKAGDQTPSGRLATGEGGYLVSAFDPISGNTRDARIFRTESTGSHGATTDMALFIEDQEKRGSLFMITSLETPGQRRGALTVSNDVTVKEWSRLARAVASIGGTRDTFNRAAITPNRDYTLIGWSGAGEGNGQEVAGPQARLRGVLVPENDSELRPQNVNADGPPKERLQQLIVRLPDRSWPYNDDPGVRAAITYLGSEVPQLGPRPRTAYWMQGFTQAQTNALRARLADVDPPPADMHISPADLETARRELRKELLWVGNTREYLDQLAAPSGKAGAAAWEDARNVADRLAANLKELEEKAKAQVDWFSVVRSMLEFAGGLVGFKVEHAERFISLLEVAAAALEAGHVGYESVFEGGDPSSAEERFVRADEVGDELKRQADNTVLAVQRMQYAIVSDYAKLKEVGTYAGCNPDNGCPKGLEQYAVTPQDVHEATALTRLSIERSVYSQLVPLSFPAYDTGLTRHPTDPSYFRCTSPSDSPFPKAPAADIARSLDELDPSGAVNRYEVSLFAARSGQTWGYPSEHILHRMFDAVDPEAPEAGGLALSPVDVMRAASNKFEQTSDCRWQLGNTEAGVLNGDEPPPR